MKKNYAELFASFGLWNLVEDTSDDGDGEVILTEEGEKFVRELDQSQKQPEDFSEEHQKKMLEKYGEVSRCHYCNKELSYKEMIDLCCPVCVDCARVVLGREGFKKMLERVMCEPEKQEEWRERYRKLNGDFDINLQQGLVSEDEKDGLVFDFISQLLSERTFNKEELDLILECIDVACEYPDIEEKTKLIYEKIDNLLNEE
jgi:hypothetical protein